VLVVTLSERNLIVMLSKLYTPGSKCTIGFGNVPEGFADAWLRAEPDELHYASPTREGAPPGPMHPLAEVVLLAVQQAISEFVVTPPVSEQAFGPLLWLNAPEEEQ
jgi:hypothetical protein